MSGDHSRHTPEARKKSKVDTTSVTRATVGPAASGASEGMSSSRFRATGKMVAAISMSTVPVTTGVITRRKNGSQKASTR